MQPVVTVAEMRRADAAATVPEQVLIARAGWAVAHEAMRMLGGAYGRRVTVVAGSGNNGADGRWAAAALARRGARVQVVAAGASGRLPASDLVIDAAFGTGFHGTYAAPDAGGSPVLAVDIASGIDGDTGQAGPGAVRADVTVTMAAPKPGLLLGAGPDHCGRVTVAPIGLDTGPARIHLVEDADIGWLPPRRPDAHKWGSAVWVVAGSPGMRGAPELCAHGAQRAGAGMVRLGSPGLAASEHPAGEAVAVGLGATGWETEVLAGLDRFAALVLGPGLGRDEATGRSVQALVAATTVPTVVDADGLYALGQPGRLGQGGAPLVLTPHDGEFTRLAGHKPGPDRIGDVRALAARTGAVVLLKGPTTVVAHPDGRVLLAASGDARLATAGTGDVLSGMVGAFLAAGLEPLRAAALAAHVHGRAARRGPRVGLVAGDLPPLVAAVLSGQA